MLRRHATTIAMICRDTHVRPSVFEYFSLPAGRSLMSCLVERKLGQADLVLCLLHLRDRSRAPSRLLNFYIERLVGRSISVGPSCTLLWRHNSQSPVVTRPPSGYERKITFVVDHNPRQRGTDAHERWSCVRPGRTLAQLLVRGFRRRDVRVALRRGWIRVDDAQ